MVSITCSDINTYTTISPSLQRSKSTRQFILLIFMYESESLELGKQTLNSYVKHQRRMENVVQR